MGSIKLPNTPAGLGGTELQTFESFLLLNSEHLPNCVSNRQKNRGEEDTLTYTETSSQNVIGLLKKI